MEDASIDPTFAELQGDVPISSYLTYLAVQSDGRVIVTHSFQEIGGGWFINLARLQNDPATETLSVTSAHRIEWLRGGSSPVATRVDFELSTDSGATFSPLGSGTPISGGWELTGISLPTDGMVRARALVTSGIHNASVGLIETEESFSGLTLSNNDDLASFVISEGTLSPAFSPAVFSYTSEVGSGTGTFSVTLTASETLLTVTRAEFPPGEIDPDFSAGANNRVICVVAQPDGKLLAGGFFDSANGTTRNHVARFHTDGSLDTGFDPDANDWVYSVIVMPDGKLLIGGIFTSVNGVTRNRIARINPDGTLDTGFNPNAGDHVLGLTLLPDQKLLVSGTFITIGGVNRAYLARLNPNGTVDTTFSPGPNKWPYAMALQPDGGVILGGQFTFIGGASRAHIARLLPNGTIDPAFNPNANHWVYTATLQTDGKILIGGEFTTVGGTPRSRIARLNPDGTLDTGFNPNAGGQVYNASNQADGKVLVGGIFTNLKGVPKDYIGRMTNDPASSQIHAEALGIPGASRVEWIRGGSSPEATRVTFEASADGGSSYQPLGDPVRIAGGWELTGLDLPTNVRIRARAFTVSGLYNAGGGMIEDIVNFTALVIGLSGNGVAITAGDATPDVADHTVFPPAAFPGGASSRVFTISNSGAATLLLPAFPGIQITRPHADDFSLALAPPPSVVGFGGAATFTLTCHPSGPGVRSATVAIPSDDPVISSFTFAMEASGVTPLSLFEQAMTDAALVGPLALPEAIPQKDGISNLLKYAFRLDLQNPDVRSMIPVTGILGLPTATYSAPQQLRIQYVRRIASGLIYTPVASSTLSPPWNPILATPVVEAIDHEWERVTYDHPFPGPQGFVRVQVSFPEE